MVEGVGEGVPVVSVPESAEAEEQLREGVVEGPGERMTTVKEALKMEEGGPCHLGEEVVLTAPSKMACGSQEAVVVSCQLEGEGPS